ncbi:Ribosomal RNA large subunit methyltransferase F [Babesia bigemina]|uniref:Ribosomal RNA large subunit methyltransferase F n=1 Tax=Babesia bigemina TaxID=5866 RepID=A0A061DDH0_BABBI|nr:Ribosomal RNA large subunit methyltransferase F [Babesia bigemina]CDR97394.1 Ribosomal RNA large subunit methyltransferase F [Babesia bigemina]|eukprot:XP_012769580.1 Ribosomal RNA large subunit methyltransferase F [Babesia bigemina]
MGKRGRHESKWLSDSELCQQPPRRSEPSGRSCMHHRSRHTNRDDFIALSRVFPVLKQHLVANSKWKSSMSKHLMYHYDFSHPDAVYHLSRAILKITYGLNFYLPCGCRNGACDPFLRVESGEDDCDTYLDDSECIDVQRYLAPCIPGRANYVHYAADLLHVSHNLPDPPPEGTDPPFPDSSNISFEDIPRGQGVKVLDVGTGANCIYPLLGCSEYGWSFIASETNLEALTLAKHNLRLNGMTGIVDLRHQKEPLRMFTGALQPNEFVHLTMCNPPFHASLDQTNMNPRVSTCGTTSELTFQHGDVTTFSIDGVDLHNLQKVRFGVTGQVNYTFSSDPAEQGELAFVEIMLVESRFFVHNVLWFTSLVARLSTLKRIKSHIHADMRLYHASSSKQVAFLDARVSDLLREEGSSAGCEDTFHIPVSNLHVCELRTFTLSQGRQTRWVVAWTYFNAEQRYKILKKLYS